MRKIIIILIISMLLSLCAQATYSDIQENIEIFDKLQESEIIVGYNDKYNPSGKVTIEQLTTILSRISPDVEIINKTDRATIIDIYALIKYNFPKATIQGARGVEKFKEITRYELGIIIYNFMMDNDLFPEEYTIGQLIVDTAYQYLGCDYAWGGTGPYSFDCSGFVQYVFSLCGYSIARTASAQLDYGSYVTWSELEPGDIVFFTGTYYSGGPASHVGIYIGNDQFIHAANSRSGVTISYLTDDYYANKFIGGRRIA